MATETRGKYVLGLQPYDRMPNDWLRMVARVFAAYRKVPLEESIVAYIDGLNLALVAGGGPGSSFARVSITPGQAFVDDQFVGFKEISYIEFKTNWLNVDEKYCISLFYEWINQTPPQEPHFKLVARTVAENSQQHLCLGYAIKRADGSIEIIDKKVPWYKEMVNAMTGDTEVDEEELLPYLIKINEPESENDGITYEVSRSQTLDIGWALDFHDEIGNNVDYDIRLHTDRQGSGDLYINDKRIFTYINPYDPNFNEDPHDLTDAVLPFEHNLMIVDDQTLNQDGDPINPISNSGKGCLSFKTIPQDINDGIQGATICFDRNGTNLSLKNTAVFGDSNGVINDLTLTDTTDVVTINGKPIWHTGNLESSGKNIYFLGVYSDADPDDFPTERLDGTPLHDGDTLYNDNYQAYFFWHSTAWVQVGKTESSKQYEFEAIEGQTSVQCKYNPNFVMVSVAGVVLSKASYVANDGNYIIFNNPLQEGEMVTVHTVIGGQNIGIELGEIQDISFINLTPGDVLQYREVGQPGNYTWTNHAVSIAHLIDVDDVTNTIGDREILMYNATTSSWDAAPYPTLSINDMQDVEVNAAAIGDILQLQTTPGGDMWVNTSFYDSLPQDLGALTGGIHIWPDDNVPAGYLECNGALVSRTLYSKLFNIIGTRFGPGDGSTTFRLPDLRGEFIRGWDHGRGVDNARGIGTNQIDLFKNHQHWTGMGSNNPAANHYYTDTTGTPSYSNAKHPINGCSGCTGDQAITSPNGGAETRPRNVAMMYIIKY